MFIVNRSSTDVQWAEWAFFLHKWVVEFFAFCWLVCSSRQRNKTVTVCIEAGTQTIEIRDSFWNLSQNESNCSRNVHHDFVKIIGTCVLVPSTTLQNTRFTLLKNTSFSKHSTIACYPLRTAVASFTRDNSANGSAQQPTGTPESGVMTRSMSADL